MDYVYSATQRPKGFSRTMLTDALDTLVALHRRFRADDMTDCLT